MTKHFSEWPDYDEQVPLYDIRGWDQATVDSVGVLSFTRAMPRADVIALKPGELLCIEFDNQMAVTHISHLDRYLDAIANDVLRPDWRTRRHLGAYVTPAWESRIEDECLRKGYIYIVEREPRP